MTTLSARLRRERERQGITLDSIAATTKISASLFAGLERGDVSRWPSGIFRRSFIRAYATAIGLDPDAVCREFNEQFPEADADRRRIVAQLAQPDRHPSRWEAGPVAVELRPVSALRLTLAEAGGSFRLSRLLRVSRYRWAAAACDLGAVTTLAAAGYVVAGQFWLPLALSAVFYYGVSALLLDSTPGVWWWLISRRGETPAASAPVTMRPHVVDMRLDEADDEAVLAPSVAPAKLHRLVRIERRRRAGA